MIYSRFGEVDRLQVSLAGARAKLAHLDPRPASTLVCPPLGAHSACIQVQRRKALLVPPLLAFLDHPDIAWWAGA